LETDAKFGFLSSRLRKSAISVVAVEGPFNVWLRRKAPQSELTLGQLLLVSFGE
jgi:hypothetical protein